MKCSECSLFVNGMCTCESCAPNDQAPCEVEDDEDEMARYTVWYEGIIFDGDAEDGINEHNCETFAEAMKIYERYPEFVAVHDNIYNATLWDGEWN